MAKKPPFNTIRKFGPKAAQSVPPLKATAKKATAKKATAKKATAKKARIVTAKGRRGPKFVIDDSAYDIPKKATAKKATAKKATAKKATAKKTPAKKTAKKVPAKKVPRRTGKFGIQATRRVGRGDQGTSGRGRGRRR